MSAAQEKTPRVGETIRVVRFGVRGLYRSRLPQMAAALAFRTLFALIPMLVISVAAIGAFAEPEDVKVIMEQTFDNLGISDIQVQVRDPKRSARRPKRASIPSRATPAPIPWMTSSSNSNPRTKLRQARLLPTDQKKAKPKRVRTRPPARS